MTRRARRRGQLRRAGWALGDQGISSLTNFALSVLVARSVTADEFGAFGLAFTVYLFLIGLTRAVTSEPLLVRFSDREPAEHRRGVVAATGTAVTIGAVAGIGCLVASVVVGGTLGPVLAVLGVALPGLLLQDTWRYTFFAQGAPQQATVNDLVWATAQLVLAALVLRDSSPSAAWFVAAWGASGSLAAVLGWWQSGVRPDPRSARRWCREQRGLIPAFVGEFAARNGARQATLFAVGAIGGLAALGSIRAAQVLFGPLNVVLLSLPLLAVPEAVRLVRVRPERLAPAVTTMSAVLALAGLLAGALALAIPNSMGTALFGATWTDARAVLVPQALFLASVGATSGFLVGLRALEAATESLVARVVIAPLTVGAGVVGALVAGAPGAMYGMAAANGVGVVVWWAQFRRAAGRRSAQPIVGIRPQASATVAGSVTTT